MELGEKLPFGSELVDHRRSNITTVASEVGIAQVIGDNEQYVGSGVALGKECRGNE
jgi:hypothetical protein